MLKKIARLCAKEPLSSHNERRFTGERRNCLPLVSVHDTGLKLTLRKVKQMTNTVYFLDPDYLIYPA